MSASVRRLRHGILQIGSVGVIVAGMAAIDDKVRGFLFDGLRGDLPIALRVPDLRVQHLSRMITDTIGLSPDAQFPLMVFGIFGIVLFVLMFRS